MPETRSRTHRFTDYLQGLRFPARTEDIVRVARNNGAPDHVQAVLRRLPGGQRFDDADALTSELPPSPPEKV